ncbi:MAG: glycosyltransferase family 4 protein [Aristaeellaceae bacterium]
MQVLWITNQPIGGAARKLQLKLNSGTWMEPTLKDLLKHPEVQVAVATKASVTELTVVEAEDATHYLVPATAKKIYPYWREQEQAVWKKIIDQVKPDIIMIWGTEYAHGLCALRQAEGIPAVIVIQGILDTIAEFYLCGMSAHELRRCTTLRSIIKRDSIRQEQKLFRKKAVYEQEMLRRAGHVIVENDWARGNIRRIAPGCQLFEMKQKINELFFHHQWQGSACRQHVIFCTAPVGYPLKGFHNILKALALVKEKYPDVRLRVPGIEDPYRQTWKLRGWLIKRDYTQYIMQLIDQLGLKGHIDFLGHMEPADMAKELEEAHLFVAASSIENQSTSLREAMVVGTPCIASFAGGMGETIQDRVNGRLYRCEDYGHLAYIVDDLFSHADTCQAMSKHAQASMRAYWDDASPEQVYQIYQSILREKS